MKKTKLREVVKCRDCQDSKDCERCRGSGMDPEPGEMKDCKDCGGTGRCPWCDEDA